MSKIVLPQYIEKIDGDKAYPIFRIQAVFDQDGYENNSSSSNRMYREMPSSEQSMKDAIEWWNDLINNKNHGDKIPVIEKHPKLKFFELKLIEYETWCLKWFNHYTYVDGRTDDEVIASFHRFIQRKLPLHYKSEYCLMGAEDEWRLKPPCHCEHCTKSGITYIDH